MRRDSLPCGLIGDTFTRPRRAPSRDPATVSDPAPHSSLPSQFVAGRELGSSAWITITQSMISEFGEATRDPDPMHVDPVWAADGPFNGTIAFGFLTMSLLTHLLHDVLGTDPRRHDPAHGYYLNYGFDRMRLVSPVRVGSRIRGTFRVAEIKPDAKARSIVKFNATVEIEGSERPALSAEWLTVWVPPESA
jgi:acyl dehydratase